MNYTFKDGFYADIRIEDRFSTLISFFDNELQQSRVRLVKRAFIRVFDGKMWYYSSTTDIDNIQCKLNDLYSVAVPDNNILNNPVVKKFEINNDTRLKYNSNSVRDIPFDEKYKLLETYLPVFKQSDYIKTPSLIYLDRNSQFEFYSSLGSKIIYDYQTCAVVERASLVNGNKKFNARFQKAVTDFSELTNLFDEIKESLADQIDFMLNAEDVTPGDYPVVLSPEAAGIFAHESFGHKSESDFMLSNENMKKEWQLGKQVASPLLTISEYGDIPGSGYVPYDDEGTKAKKNYLIKDGVLTGRLHSALTASALDEKLTGNARAIDCTFEPIVRMTNTYIEGGVLTFDELIAPIKNGYFIKSVNHGSGMSTFTLAPSQAYKIENGKITRPVNISVISGSVFETLGLIDGVSKDVKILSFATGGCGKLEQYPLPVGFGGPYVRVSKMRVQ